MFIEIRGNLVTGFDFIGPFEDDKALKANPRVVAPLEPVKERTLRGKPWIRGTLAFDEVEGDTWILTGQTNSSFLDGVWFAGPFATSDAAHAYGENSRDVIGEWEVDRLKRPA